MPAPGDRGTAVGRTLRERMRHLHLPRMRLRPRATVIILGRGVDVGMAAQHGHRDAITVDIQHSIGDGLALRITCGTCGTWGHDRAWCYSHARHWYQVLIMLHRAALVLHGATYVPGARRWTGRHALCRRLNSLHYYPAAASRPSPGGRCAACDALGAGRCCYRPASTTSTP